MDKELIDAFKMIGEREERELEELSEIIDKIIDNKIENERTISEVLDSILSIAFIEDNIKRKTFHKLSDYCSDKRIFSRECFFRK